MKFLLNSLWRMHQHRSWYQRWFCIDKPARMRTGAGSDGLFDSERSEGDRERAGLKKPDKPVTKECDF